MLATEVLRIHRIFLDLTVYLEMQINYFSKFGDDEQS